MKRHRHSRRLPATSFAIIVILAYASSAFAQTTTSSTTTTTLPQNSSIVGVGVVTYTLPGGGNARDTVTVNVLVQNSTISNSDRKMTITRLNPRGAIISTGITGYYCGNVISIDAPSNSIREGQVHGVAMKTALDRDYNYVVKMWDRSGGMDGVYYKVWKGGTTTVEIGPRVLLVGQGAFTLTP